EPPPLPHVLTECLSPAIIRKSRLTNQAITTGCVSPVLSVDSDLKSLMTLTTVLDLSRARMASHLAVMLAVLTDRRTGRLLAVVSGGKKDRAAIKAALARGMKELTGADDAVSAWRRFFGPGDVVGIKVVPNGHPLAPTSPKLVLEVIAALESAGVKKTDMFVF